ncbi:MAG: Gldg family protein [Petrotogales bacterium]
MKKYFIAVILVAIFLSLISCAPTLRLLSKSILIDNTHNNENNYDNYAKEVFFGTLISELESMYHTVDFTSEVGFSPSQYDILILDAPFTTYTYSEGDKVKSFLRNGGTLVALGEKAAGYWNNTYLNDMLSYLGVDIRFESNIIYDYTNYYEEYFWPKIIDFENHPTTNSLTSIVLFAACTLDVFGSAEVVAESSTVNVIEAFSPQEENNISSSAISKESLTNPQVSITVPIIGVDYVDSGKVIAIPDVTLFGDDVYNSIDKDYIEVHDNMQLLMNIIYW